MSFLKRISKGKTKDQELYKNAPALNQLMEDMKKEEKEFIERLEKILPVINVYHTADKNLTSSEASEQAESASQIPLSYPVNFDDDLCINLRMDYELHSGLLLDRHIEIAKEKITPDQLIKKAYGNLFRQIENDISISMITEDIGKLSNCMSLESSLVLINEIWVLIRKQLQADEIVFGIPAQDLFVFTAANNHDKVEQLDLMVKEYFNDSVHLNKLNKTLYIVYNDGRTEKFRE